MIFITSPCEIKQLSGLSSVEEKSRQVEAGDFLIPKRSLIGQVGTFFGKVTDFLIFFSFGTSAANRSIE